MSIKHLEEKVRILESVLPDVKIIEESNKKHYLKCFCAIHNHYWEAYYYNLKKGSGCPKCKSEKIRNLSRLSLIEVLEEFKKRSLKPLFEEYKNNQEKLLCETKEGYKVLISLGHLKTGKKPTAFGNGNPYTVENIKIFIKNNTDDYVLLSKEFDSACGSKIKMKCNKNHIFKITWNDFQQGKRCRECSILRGEKHPFYNPALTEEERLKRRDLKSEESRKWRNNVYKRDNYTCQICGDNNGGNLNAHHLDGWNWCIEKRFDIGNGISLCVNCHNDFHLEYGYGNNTKEQFDKFKTKKVN